MQNSKPSPQDLAKAELAKRTLARRNLLDFTCYTKPNYIPSKVHGILCRKLEQFISDVEEQKSPRLMIFMPPRRGKSEIVSRRFPAFVYGHYPEWGMIAASHNIGLARKMNKDVQRIMTDPSYERLFEKVRLPGKNLRPAEPVPKNADEFGIINPDGRPYDTEGHRAFSAGQGIAGQGAHIVNIDDPFRNRKDANSPTVQQTIFDWYQDDAETRLTPGGGVLLTHTRWHVEDLAGRLLAEEGRIEEGGIWEVICFPEIAEEDEYFEGQLFRKQGELLCPERYGPEDAERHKKKPGWVSLYQQRPTIPGGDLIKEAWFQWYDENQLPPLKEIVAIADTATKAKEHNDPTVVGLFGKCKDGNVYVLDLIRDRIESPDLQRRVSAFWNKHFAFKKGQPRPRMLYVEDKSSGSDLIMRLKREKKIPVTGVPRDVDKVQRVNMGAPYIEMGRVYLPTGTNPYTQAEWVNDFLDECKAFRGDMTHKHDDQVDVLMDAVEKMIIAGSASIWDAI